MSQIVVPHRSALALIGAWLKAFVSAPASPRPLAALRIGLAAVLLLQSISLLGSVEALFGSQGYIQAPITEGTASPWLPRVTWATEALAGLGLNESATLRALFCAYLGSLAGLLAGWHTRLMALAAFGLHLALKTSSHLSAYGVYEFAHIGLFYCLWFPVGGAWSLDRRAGRTSGEPSAEARLGLRLLQLHLCVVYLASGFEKATGIQWWNGEAVWRALSRPDFAV